jgi:homoserine kinase
LYRQDPIAAAKVIHDVIAEPWRKALLPGFDQARAYAMSNGALAFGISGSGPTVFGIASNLDDAQKIKTYLDQHYVQNSDGFSHVCTIPNCGATAEQHSE